MYVKQHGVLQEACIQDCRVLRHKEWQSATGWARSVHMGESAALQAPTLNFSSSTYLGRRPWRASLAKKVSSPSCTICALYDDIAHVAL